MKAWLKRQKEADEVLRIIPGREDNIRTFVLLRAYDMGAPSLGKILFDMQGYWIYDGDDLLIDEQEQMAAFIIKNFFTDDQHLIA